MSRSATLLALLVAGCAASAPPPEAVPTAAEARPPVPLAVRAAAAGLTGPQAEALAAVGYVVLVPEPPAAFRLDSLQRFTVDGTFTYGLRYGRSDGACVWVRGASDLFGGPFLPDSVGVSDVPALPSVTPVTVYRASDDSAAAYPMRAGAFRTALLMGDGMGYLVESGTDPACRSAAASDVGSVTRSLRPLDPADDDVLGPFALDASALVVDRGVDLSTEAPAAHARQFFAAGTVPEVEALRETASRATLLVTQRDLPDPAVRDRRYRVTYALRKGRWLPVRVWAQVRCRPGHGAEAWGAQTCR